nr:uncharacterized protein LOC109159271 isoform X1 [Ipomoea batatas]
MGSLLGFRPPQFSEDGAWLPCWLQPEDNGVETSDEGSERGQSSSEQCVEEYHNFQKNISNASAGQLSGEEVGYKSCHLYLSGDDSSLLSFTPSIDNVVQFHLHLSLGCNSEDMPNSSNDTAQVERNEINRNINVQRFEVSGEPEVKASQLYMDHNIDVINCSLIPELGGTDEDKRLKGLEENARLLEVEQMFEASQLNVDQNIDVMNCYLVPECDGTDKDKNSKVLEENTRLLEVEQMNDAVEMSISASEALVIHEVLRTMSCSKSLPAAAVLEAALQVKQARLEVWKESDESYCNWLTKEISETDFQSESEDLNMEDTDHDVGISASQYSLQGDHLSVSQVKDTLDSENCGCDGKSKSEEVLPPNISHPQCIDNFVNQQLEDVHENDLQLKQNIIIESSRTDWQNKVIKESSMGLDTTSISCDNNPMLHLLGKTVEHNPNEHHSLQATVESPIAKSFEIAGQLYGVSNTVPNRFQSRWFGGWTGDTSFSIPMGYNNNKIIGEPFVRETSYLSESADIAPDENSFVGLKHDDRANFASQSTIPSEGLYMEGNNRVFPSQDVFRSSSPSFVDPLCSVVPCSIPSQNMPSPSALCDEQVNMEKCFIPGTENIIESASLLEKCLLDNKALPTQLSISEASADRSEHPVRRKLTSLRSFSMILPRNGSLLEKGSLNKTFLPERSDTLQYLPQQNLYGSANNAHELPSGHQEETNSHLMLKSKTKGPVQHSNCFPSDYTAEANRKQMEGGETLAGVAPNLNLLKLHSIHEYQNTASLGTRKRVRFAETETKAPHREKRQKQQITSYTRNTRHTMRAAKCLRLSNSESRAQNLKGCLTNCQGKFEKKLLFQSMKFLLTGFPKQKEKRIEDLIRKYGGTVLSDIPSSENQRKRSSRLRAQGLPVVLCSKKLQTLKFLYGCAVSAMMVKAKWLTDSIAASSLLPPERYMILQKYIGEGSMQTEIRVKHSSSNAIFDGVGIMLHGAKIFCAEMAKIVKHGGARVFKTLQNLVLSLDAAKITIGVVVTEDGSWESRHLKKCTLEKKIPIMPVNWIVNSLHAQKLLPFTEKEDTFYSHSVKLPDTSGSVECSQEI